MRLSFAALMIRPTHVFGLNIFIERNISRPPPWALRYPASFDVPTISYSPTPRPGPTNCRTGPPAWQRYGRFRPCISLLVYAPRIVRMIITSYHQLAQVRSTFDVGLRPFIARQLEAADSENRKSHGTTSACCRLNDRLLPQGVRVYFP